MEAREASTDDAQTENNDAPDFVQEIIALEGGEFIGINPEQDRVGMYADRVSDLHTDIALKNGWVVAEVRTPSNRTWNLNVQFKRLA